MKYSKWNLITKKSAYGKSDSLASYKNTVHVKFVWKNENLLHTDVRFCDETSMRW